VRALEFVGALLQSLVFLLSGLASHRPDYRPIRVEAAATLARRAIMRKRGSLRHTCPPVEHHGQR
jgi:hypothetical protein